MHLKSLTMKGFKSFASATTLRLEPGITCVVGPNGSGKSNVVDAISWVLGEQGAKALRGGKMEDVIFAGTSGRAPLGRAEVTLTIDNSDGALPIEYSEVSITRRMFRDGAGEYEINGATCRLLDIQELLSDSGIGREMHVVVGQGQLDSVLQSRPEDRRAYIEEAAGVLKHRKRKEKALRKLDAMQTNLTRLTDLTGELRRQLKPLGRQAELARRAQAVQSELRDARLRLAADDLVTLRAELEREGTSAAAASARRAEAEQQLAAARVEQERLEAALAQDAPRLAAAQDTWYRLSALAERISGTVRLARERSRHLADPQERVPGREPDELDAEAAAAAERERELAEALVRARRRLADVEDERAGHERALAAAERAHAAAVRAMADRRAGLATLAGRAAALRSGAAATAGEIERLSEALTEAHDRTGAAEAELAHARDDLGTLDEDAGPALERRCAEAVGAHESARDRVAELVARERRAEQQRAHWRARVDALAVGLARRDGSGALLGEDGVLGPLSGLVTVEPAARTAIAAALGEVADAVAVASPDAAVVALRRLRSHDAGRAALVVGRAVGQESHVAALSGPESGFPEPGEAPVGRWAGELVSAREPVAAAVRRLLHGVVVVDDLDAARVVVAGDPELVAVTRDGDLLGGHRASGGSGDTSSALDVQAAVDEAGTELGAVEQELVRLRPALDGARAEEAARLGDLEAAQQAQGAAEQRRSTASARLGRLEQAVRSAAAEAQRLRERRDAVEVRRSDALLALEAAEQQLAVAEGEPVDDEPDTAVRDAAAAALAAARSEEVEARLGLRTVEERVRSGAGRAESLRRQAAAERQARARAAAARQARERAATIAALVASAGETAGERLAESLALAATERDAAAAARDVPGARARRGPRDDAAAHGAVGRADRRRPPRRGAPRAEPDPPGAAHREGARRARPRPGRARRRVRTGRAGSGVRRRDGGVRGGARARGAGRRSASDGLRPRRSAGPGPARRAGPRVARPGQPARAGGVRGAGGALPVPVHPARGPQEHPPRPPHRGPRGRRQDPRGVRHGLHRRRAGVRDRLLDALPRW